MCKAVRVPPGGDLTMRGISPSGAQRSGVGFRFASRLSAVPRRGGTGWKRVSAATVASGVRGIRLALRDVCKLCNYPLLWPSFFLSICKFYEPVQHPRFHFGGTSGQ